MSIFGGVEHLYPRHLYVLAERPRRCRAMDRLDMRGEPKYSGEHSCIIGKRKTAPNPCQGSVARSNDEVGKRCEQDTAHSHWGRRIEGTVVSRHQVLHERKSPGELLERGPKISAHGSLLLLEVLNGGLIPRSHDHNLWRKELGRPDMPPACSLQVRALSFAGLLP